jgi:FkbH-like protein
MRRTEEEGKFKGPQEGFLATLGMELTIAQAQEEDLQRAEELTVRTHQLNTTGYAYTHEELRAFSRSAGHRLYIVGLEDRFGAYGKIGLALMETGPEVWTIKLLLMSCRVVARGVGSMMISFLRRSARDSNVRLRAEFVANDRNRMMNVTYRLAGFKPIGEKDGLTLLENDLSSIPPCPAYVRMLIR